MSDEKSTTNELKECPTCEQRHMAATTYDDTFTREGETDGVFVTGLEGYRCSACGETCMVPGQIKRNETRIANARAAQHLERGKAT